MLAPARGLLLVVLLGLPLSVAVQAARGLYRPDEGRYVSVALRMLDTGDWLHPELSHGHEHYTKPPLTYWTLAASMALLGRNAFAARLPNTLALLATVLLIWVAARRLQPRRPWLAPVLYAIAALPHIAANFVTTDTLLTLFTTMTLTGFVAWRFSDGQPRAFLLWMWLGLALGFLTKGPPVLLPLLPIVVFCVWQDGWRSLARLRLVAGGALFIVLGLGWYVLVVVQRPALLETFLRHEVADRLFTSAHRRNADPIHILDMYLPVLLFGTFPWIWQAVRGVARAVGDVRERRHADARLLLPCLLLPTLIFCLVPSRLPLYLLQVFPACLLLAARSAPDDFLRHRRSPALLAGLMLVGAAAMVGMRWWPTGLDSRALAKTVEARVPFAPSEVIFFGSPHRGLALYLDCEVDSIRLHPTEGDPRSGLEQELREAKPRLVFCVRDDMRAGFLAETDRLDVPMQRLGAWCGLELFCRASEVPVRSPIDSALHAPENG